MGNFLNTLKPTVTLEEAKSSVNGRVLVKRSWGLGTYIEVGGLTQSGGILNTIWGSTIKHIKKDIDPKNILILGLGGGTIANVTQKYFPDAKIVGVDIDPVMIRLGKKYLGLDEKRIRIVIQDAYDFVKMEEKNKNKYDLVLVDLFVGDNYPSKFEKDEFIKLTKRLIIKGGTVIFNELYFGTKRKNAVKFGERLRKVFSKVEYYYPEANLMLVCFY